MLALFVRIILSHSFLLSVARHALTSFAAYELTQGGLGHALYAAGAGALGLGWSALHKAAHKPGRPAPPTGPCTFHEVPLDRSGGLH